MLIFDVQQTFEMLKSSLSISRSMDYFSTLPLFFLPEKAKTYSDFQENVIRSYWNTEQQTTASNAPCTVYSNNGINNNLEYKQYSFSIPIFFIIIIYMCHSGVQGGEAGMPPPIKSL
jgi:hypothetical protein